MQAKPIPAQTLLPIHAGQIHYSRIPVEYWQHRIQMVKALGLNALSIYIMWNYHEVQRGVFDFQTGNKNLWRFLLLAEKHDMLVLFRPGPYVCAEWDFGGLPARLLAIEGIEMRANNKIFLDETRVYFEALLPILHKHSRTETNKNGCIVMLQIENQYGFYGTDKAYMQSLKQIWRELDVNLTQYYVDWLQNIHKCHWQGANIGINDFSKKEQQEAVRVFEKKGFILGGEIYSGWMTHWTEKWGGKSIPRVLADYEFLLTNKHSFAMYMVHGGTNFGLTAGANGLKDKVNDYWGAITSYDYDAPINEQGSPTPKYHALRELFQKHIKTEFPPIPAPIPMIEIPPIELKAKGNLLNNLPCHYTSAKPPLFESPQLQMFNQGIVVYETTLPEKESVLDIIVHDFAIVFLGHEVIKVLDRTQAKDHVVKINQSMIEEYGRRLRILVEASGHINFDKNMWSDFKGLYKVQGLAEVVWRSSKIPIDYKTISNWQTSLSYQQNNHQGDTFPKLYDGSFYLEETGDTYLDVSGYGKGYLWINGHNLGRYWDAGPQKRLFCPGVWLNKGSNEVMVLNVYGKAGAPIVGVKELYDTPIVYEK